MIDHSELLEIANALQERARELERAPSPDRRLQLLGEGMALAERLQEIRRASVAQAARLAQIRAGLDAQRCEQPDIHLLG